MATFLETHTSEQQHVLELKVSELFQELADAEPGPDRDDLLLLLRDRHARYLQGGLGQLPGGFVSLDASKPWICYWILHGLALLDQPLPSHITAQQVIAFLSSCQHPTGGYGGGPGQLPHLAPTYAAVSALLTLGTEEAYGSIDRPRLFDFLSRMTLPPEQGGGFRMHAGGESDVRSCYTALAVAHNLCLDVPTLVERSGVVDYIRRCQTYEGGIGGEPGNEAHGGYTFCGLAALVLAGCPQVLDLPRLLHWACQRQGWVEGGFNGRTNKLVDGCYSFWQGGVFPLLQQLLGQQEQQAPARLEPCCTAETYPPLMPPAAWQHQQPQQQQGRLTVPDLPDLSRVVGPLQQAELDAERLNEACDLLTEAALRSAGQAHQQQAQGSQTACADADGDGGAAAAAEPAPAESRHEVLARAQAAQKAADYADENAAIAAASAALLYPCTLHQQQQPAADAPATGQAAISSSSSSSSVAPAANPLFNTSALQCWILRACQQLKGGLRDKPGKSGDYYHSCYCLSGLSVAQNMAGGGGVGVARNALRPTSPLLNILEERLQAARQHFGRLPAVEAATQPRC